MTSNENVSESHGISENEAEALGSMFVSDDEPKEGDQNQKEEVETENETEEAAEPNPEEDEGDQQEETDAEQDEEQQPDEYFATDEMKVKLSDGSEVNVSELSKSYFREKDYTQSKQELSSKRKEVNEWTERLIQHAEQAKSEKEMALQVMERMAPPEPDISLLDTDPLGYQRAKAQFDKYSQDYYQIAQAIDGDNQRIYEANAQETRDKQLQAQKQILEELPHLADRKVAQEFAERADKIMIDAGFAQDEISQFATDVRVIKLLDRLNTLENAERTRQAGKAKAKTQPKRPPFIKGGRRKGSQSGAIKQFDNRLKSAQKSGRPEDVGDILSKLLK